MKNTLKLITLLYIIVNCSVLQAQTLSTDPKIDHSMPKIEPPSPTVAALMRFEEIPVSNYTGVPDISIPIYSIQSHSKDISLDVSLKYHPSSIAVDEVASVTGLGWSLFAGGSISRTVRGIPDEWYNAKSALSGPAKVGIYRDDEGVLESNHYYDLMPLFGTNMTPAQMEDMSTFLWETHEKGKFDTEHDLYQFNFMGHLGRFIIKKNSFNQFSVVRLDNDNAITVEYTAGIDPYFTVYDDKGYKYIFDIRETTKQWTDILNIYLDGSQDVTFSSGYVNYISSFQLSKIYRNTSLLVEFIYNDESEIMNENTTSFNGTSNSNFAPYTTLITAGTQCPGEIKKVDPMQINSNSHRNVKTKKLKVINVIDKSRIYFTYENGRLDTNLEANPFKLKKIEIKDWNSVPFKEFELHYTNSIIGTSKRMLLQKVTERDPYNTVSQSYNLTYAPAYGTNLSKDYWGYYTVSNPFSREPHPSACKTDVLQKMTLPTGGAIVFGFESNTYSYIGADLLTDFSANIDYWLYDQEYKNFQVTSNTTSTYQNLKLSTQQQFMSWSATYTDTNATIELFKLVNNIYVPITPGNHIYLAPGVQYAMRLKTFTLGSLVTASVTIDYKEINSNTRQFLYGGGLRIKSIGHFENASVSAQYFDNNPIGQPAPLRQKDYSYNSFNVAGKSSGSLVFGKPLFTYFKNVNADIQCNLVGTPFPYSYTTTTNFNNLLPSRTHGSDVGYQNVRVSESGNGSSSFTYRSPIEFPEEPDTYTSPYPFRPSKNKDFLRGQVKMEQHRNEAGQLLKKINYTYEITADSLLTGLKVFGPNCAYSYLYSKYSNYKNPYQSYKTCGSAINYIGYMNLYESFGWTRVASKVTEEHFEGSQLITTTENYLFNPSNKKLEMHTVTNSSNESLKTNYFYISGDIQQVDSYKNNALLSRNYIQYSTSWISNNFKLPASVQNAKNGMNLETRMQYTKYDAYGNPLELQQAEGTKVAFIWGYNNSYPVAKIENMSYAAIPTPLITAIHNAYSTTNSNEASMLDALEDLRTDPALAGAMVTTMSYRPLFGVSTIIDAKGDRLTYHYDLMGRLQFVKDKQNNLLSEHEYHYRTQN